MTTKRDVYVQVLYDFAYIDGEGKEVKINKGEELLVVQKSDANWWQVIRNSERYPFYAPSCYLELITQSPTDNLVHNKDVNANLKGKRSNRVQNVSADDGQSMERKEKSVEKGSENEKPLYSLAFQNPLCVDDSDIVNSANSHESVLHNSPDSSVEVPQTLTDSFTAEATASPSTSQESELPIYANIPLSTSVAPPYPKPDDVPERELPNGWFEYVDDNCRKYYFHSPTGKVTWKPPRRSDSGSSNSHGEKNLNDSSERVPEPPPKQLKPKLKKIAHSSSESLDSPTSSYMFTILPPGWTQECDVESGVIYYRNEASQRKWYTSQDENGRTYFYDEDSCESYWELPDITQLDSEASENSPLATTATSPDGGNTSSHKDSPILRAKKVPKLPVPRQFKTQSMVVSESINIPDTDGDKTFSPASLGCVLHTGQLNKTKLVDGGRRVRKNWATSFVVLTDTFLLLYRDARSANLNASAKPEVSIDLNGALMDWCPDKSSRKNVVQISTITGHQLLLQHDDPKEMKDWFSAIHDAILKLPTSVEHVIAKSEEKEGAKHEVKLARSKSTKPVHFTKGCGDDAEVSIPAEKKRKIRNKLKNFFVRRPTMESLREKGIILDEPVFGCHLENLCRREGQSIPKFVQKCIETIEKKELTADGLYRASGNLSQVQKIRFHVNQDDYKCLDEEEDVHVLTGALKMFFREMKEPLFPFHMFSKFLTAIALPDTHSRLNMLKDLVYEMPLPNYETLKFLLNHLLKVTEFHKQNRMQVQNLAIVFGPTLMWPEEESSNIALDMMHQNRIVEFLLLEFEEIFK